MNNFMSQNKQFKLKIKQNKLLENVVSKVLNM